MKQYEFSLRLKGLGSSTEEAWQDATAKFQHDPRFEKYNESLVGKEVAIIDLHGNILGEGFLVIEPFNPLIPDEEYIQVEDSDIIDEEYNV